MGGEAARILRNMAGPQLSILKSTRKFLSKGKTNTPA